MPQVGARPAIRAAPATRREAARAPPNTEAPDTIALSNGCICCSIGDDLAAALIRGARSQPPTIAIVVETSNVSNPWRIAQLALADPALGSVASIGRRGSGLPIEGSAPRPTPDANSRRKPTSSYSTRPIWRPQTSLHRHARGAASRCATTGDRQITGCAGQRLRSRIGDMSHDAECDTGTTTHGTRRSSRRRVFAPRPARGRSRRCANGFAALPGGVLRMGIVRRDDGHFTEVAVRRPPCPSLEAGRAAPEGGPMLVAIGLREEVAEAPRCVLHFGAQADAAA